MSDDQATDDDDVIRIVRGNPTPEELAAIVSVLTTHTAAAPEPEQKPRSGWAAYWRSVRAPIRPGPGSWQAAARPW